MQVVRNGHNNYKQRYLCKTCGRRFVFRRSIDTSTLWQEYIFGKQTISQLSEKYKVSDSTIRRNLSKQHSVRIISSRKQVVVLMDTVYCGRNFGVVVFKDWLSKRILWLKFVRYETLFDYIEGVEWLEDHGFKIEALFAMVFEDYSKNLINIGFRCVNFIK